MSTASPQATTPQQDAARAKAERVKAEIEALFARVAASGPQPRLRTLTGTCQFDLAGAGTWRATVKDGVVTVVRGGDDTSLARCVVACDAEDFLRIARREGNMNILAAFLQGLLTISGDYPFAYAALGSFVLAPEGDHP